MFQITGITQPGIANLLTPDISLAFLVSRLMFFAILGAGLLFFIRLISAGYAFLTSAGDSGKTANAGKEITNAIIGLVVVIVSYFVVQAFKVIFGLQIV